MGAPRLALQTHAACAVNFMRLALLIGAAAVAVFILIETARKYRPVSYEEARAIVNRRCLECHSERPTNRAFPIAPRGVMFDRAVQMRQYAARIKATVVDRSMPLANMSGMTDEERWTLGRWVDMGAKLPE